jgi:hypothetical protein
MNSNSYIVCYQDNNSLQLEWQLMPAADISEAQSKIEERYDNITVMHVFLLRV